MNHYHPTIKWLVLLCQWLVHLPYFAVDAGPRSQTCLETPCAFNWDTKSINIADILVSNSCILAYPYCILFIYPHLMNAPLCLLFWTGCPNRSLPTMVMDTSKNHVASQVLAGWNLDLPTWETFERIWLKWFFSYVQMIGIEWNHHDYISYQPFENAKFSFYEETSTERPPACSSN